MTDTITGGVRSPRDGVAVFGFYNGPVSIRDRDGYMEVAFFASPVRVTVPTERVLDGERVRIIGITTRALDPDVPVKPRSAALRSIVATVVPVN